ncbi:glutamate racemase [Lapidilactobacillus bayanensis]|uniref:glutamate racemase n=1 Tax=Lapidilactobacillus bayanensis TaxID=2485998 RepID=UPI000F7B2783|nr:glutamate racemase [Lapidilactobacillus bayanensis]
MLDVTMPIAVFDSGVGGISTLQTLVKMLPQENFIFFGDSANAPYGEKSRDTVFKLVDQVVQQLLTKNVKSIVIACNTATSAAKPVLMEKYPELPILGIEPALKEAVDAGKHNILVMGTPLTIKSPKYQAQRARFTDQATIHSLPCPGLAELIEGGHQSLPKIQTYLAQLLNIPERDQIDAAVLGCTHYPFVTELIRQQFTQPLAVYTGYTGLGNNLRRQLAQRDLLRTTNPKRTIEFMSSKNEAAELALYHQLFEQGIGIRQLQ